MSHVHKKSRQSVAHSIPKAQPLGRKFCKMINLISRIIRISIARQQPGDFHRRYHGHVRHLKFVGQTTKAIAAPSFGYQQIELFFGFYKILDDRMLKHCVAQFGASGLPNKRVHVQSSDPFI